VTSVTSSVTNGTFGIGAVIPVQVVFSENVMVTGTPQLTLATGGAGTAVNYTSGSGTTTLIFNYTVQSGDSSSDLDYKTMNALTPNGGTITDAATNNAVLNLANPGSAGSLGANKNIVIDTTPPTVTINQAGGQADPTSTSPINFTVVFSESVTGFATGDVTISGTAGGTKTATVTGSGTTYNVAVTGMTTSGTIIATIAAAVATDTAGNGNTASTSTDNTVTWTAANTAPLATSQTATTNEDTAKTITLAGTDVDGDSLTFRVTSLPVNGKLYDGTGTAGHLITAAEAGAVGGYVVTDLAGKVTFDPNLNYNNTALTRDSFTFKAYDGIALSANGTVTLAVDPVNDAPVVVLSGFNDLTVDEGSDHTYVFAVSDVDAGDTFSVVSTSCGANGSQVGLTATTLTGGSFVCHFPDGLASSDVSVQVKDSDDAASNTPSQTVIVSNVAPTVVFTGGDTTALESGVTEHTYTYSISDPGADTVDHVTVSCGTGGTLSGTPTNSDTAGSFKCKFLDGPASPTVSASATDSDLETGNVATRAVTVNHVAPTVVVSGDFGAVDEGTTRTYTYTVTDPGLDSPTVSETCGLDATYLSDVLANSFQCKFLDGPGSSVVNVTADDGDPTNNIGDNPHTVTVNNVAPTVGALTVSGTGAVACISGNTITLAFSWTDPAGSADAPFAYAINWGDGSAIETGSTSSMSVSGRTHVYLAGGPYTISVTVTDNDSGVSTPSTSTAFSVLYNTSGILQPINLTGTRSSFKIGSTIPVKLQVTDCIGSSVGSLTLTVHLAQVDPSAVGVNEVISSSAADTGTTMRFDSSGRQYIFNLSTKLSQFNAGQDLTTGSYHVWITGPGLPVVEAWFDARM
jgi:hypothetical protein